MARYAIGVNVKFSLSSTAALIADPSRAAMLTHMLDGRAFAAGELARAANTSPQSASMHLSQLLAGGLVQVAREGRHRYYRIASSDVAHAVEALGIIAIPHRVQPVAPREAIRYARTCYVHLAGELAVKLTEAFESRGLLVSWAERDYRITPAGEEFLSSQWQVDVDALRHSRRNFARRCLDWTERRDHLAGVLGAAICRKFFELRWITRDARSRAVHVTGPGRQNLARLLDSHAA